MKTLLVHTPQEWREWLETHGAAEHEIWLVFHKKHTGVASIAYNDALDEALCFGWVDSLVKNLDDRRYARKFTPRRADSQWSPTNRKRYAELEELGRLGPPGIERPPTDRGYAPQPARRPLPSRLPAYIHSALAKHAAARRYYETLSTAQRRRYIAWVDSAKREETKLRRLKEAIRLLSSGQQLGLK
jgi:uncharacterized protein YdeI (YjbR/CyaY-like superfamily)